LDRILFGQLGANGDCLYATILAHQLRVDHPDAHITWAISSQCAGIIANNPHIDTVWEVEPHAQPVDLVWELFEREALSSYMRHEFDHVLLSQIHPNNYRNYDGTVRPSILRAYGRPITVPIANVIVLTAGEIETVEKYAASQRLSDFQHRVLFECSSTSGQSFITPDFAQDVAEQVYAMLPDVVIIFNTNLPMKLKDLRSRNSGSLSLRALAQLTKHCTLFVGCGSGGSIVATSTAAQPLPMIQLLSASTSVYASFQHDFEYFGIKDRTILEITRQDPKYIADCIVQTCREGIDTAINRFGPPIAVRFEHYFSMIERNLLISFRYIDAARSLSVTAARYGWQPELIAFGEKRIASELAIDPTWIHAKNRVMAERFRAELSEAAASTKS
jgi:ADP-heptose:LPS heptosyltransferase